MEKQILKGKAIGPGATIGLIGPSGAVRTEGAIERAVRETENMGFRVKPGKSCGQVYGYLSGTDGVRAQDVNDMFLDDEVDAIMCLKGGYGVMRMLDRIDYEAIAAHPKLIVGFSDITALHAALWEKCGLITLHGPMPMSWADGPLEEHSLRSLMNALTASAPWGEIVNPAGYERETVVPGVCEGRLVGGNLSLVDSLLGTPYEIDTRGKILFLEDVGERTYRIDRMLTHLRLAGKFEDCAGVVLGDFADCPIEYPDFGFTLEEIVRDVIVPAGKPVFSGMRVGHCTPKLTLPLGARCRMDASHCTLTVLEPVTAGN